tara:strand:- start:83975 stop:84376 length:402 start_codon:yes stop_codon:yes gene_type:complete
MASKINRTLIKKYNLDIGDFFFYENFLVAEVKEGIAFSFENAKEILGLAKMYYGNKTPFVYITNRKNSYSFNPTSHFKTVPLFPNLKGFAAVVYDSINQEIAVMEQSFFSKPVNIFYNLDDAIDWVEQLIEMD